MTTLEHARTVGQIHQANRDRIRYRPVISEDTGLVTGHHGDHWSGRVDAHAHSPQIILPPAMREWVEWASRRLVDPFRPQAGMSAADAYRHQLAAVTASGMFGITQRDVWDASQLAVNFGTDTFDIRLITNSATPNFDTHDFWADLSANEVSGTGYTADGQALTSLTVTINSGTLEFDSADTTWSASSITARAAVIVDDTLTNDPLIALLNYGSDIESTNGDFVNQMPSGGWHQHDYTP